MRGHGLHLKDVRVGGDKAAGAALLCDEGSLHGGRQAQDHLVQVQPPLATANARRRELLQDSDDDLFLRQHHRRVGLIERLCICCRRFVHHLLEVRRRHRHHAARHHAAGLRQGQQPVLVILEHDVHVAVLQDSRVVSRGLGIGDNAAERDLEGICVAALSLNVEEPIIHGAHGGQCVADGLDLPSEVQRYATQRVGLTQPLVAGQAQRHTGNQLRRYHVLTIQVGHHVRHVGALPPDDDGAVVNKVLHVELLRKRREEHVLAQTQRRREVHGHHALHRTQRGEVSGYVRLDGGRQLSLRGDHLRLRRGHTVSTVVVRRCLRVVPQLAADPIWVVGAEVQVGQRPQELRQHIHGDDAAHVAGHHVHHGGRRCPAVGGNVPPHLPLEQRLSADNALE
eukprot:PhM_4_TR4917/c0_g1_i1/m.97232